ncbi:phospholipid-transporting ATPase ABCA3-like [Sorex fumeus]|uniref:phospholipid-transporting ATPase ABCA3-like n=1 Tax=Sorex fumeus TaxID=62283 RepID=UPI0024AD93FE|nr:phospholipid-transporting ATPase ABCA3-like [Sorex fumeus]
MQSFCALTSCCSELEEPPLLHPTPATVLPPVGSSRYIFIDVRYNLRLSSYQRNRYTAFIRIGSWDTNVLYPPHPIQGPRFQAFPHGGSPGYFTEGFLALQHALAMSLIAKQNYTKFLTLSTVRNLKVFAKRFPYPKYQHDFFFHFFSNFVPLVVLFVFFMNHLTLIQSIVWEKDKGLKEYQLMIGLRHWMLWAAYFFTYLIFHLISISVLCIVLFIKIEPRPVLQYSELSLIVIFLLCFAFATILFSFMTSTIFSKEIGLKWKNITLMEYEEFYFAYILGMLLFDGFLYGLVTWYIESVFPGKYGMPKPWYFFMMRSYWCGEKHKIKEITSLDDTTKTQYFEEEPTNLIAGIQIKNVYKNFHMYKTEKVAVKKLTLNIYEGQITVLLGNNGAGKSTTLSILSGLYPATSGEVYINGYEVSEQIVEIRKSFGLCLQQNLLYNNMTVSEQLYFYSVLKGIPQKMRSTEIEQMLSKFNLLEKCNVYANTLSGGMKRKVSIIIALLGGSKVVILDEPTSGMDPASRRSTWDFLQHHKQGRTILLTTHYMDEADVLGDRIAIMIEGSLKCCGSPIFLKNAYGIGYHIIMVKESHCNVEEIFKLIDYYIPTATLESNLKYELSFMLPKEYRHRFEDLFTDLENRQQELGIASFGAASTTIEEVFLRVNAMEDLETTSKSTQSQDPSLINQISITSESKFRNEMPESSITNEYPVIRFNTGCFLCSQQLWALFIKKMMYNWRNWKMLLLQILAFLSSFIILSASQRHSHNYLDKNPREMDLNEYGETIVPLSLIGNENFTEFIEVLEKTLQSNNHKLVVVQGDMLQYLLKNEDCILMCIVALILETRNSTVELTALFNNEAYHSPAVSLSLVHDILFKLNAPDPDTSLTVVNKPQPKIYEKERISLTTTGIEVVLDVHFGMAFLMSGFCLLSVTEMVSKAKHIQFMSGASILIYWFSALLWDLIVFFMTSCLLMVVFLCLELNIYVQNYRFLDTVLIFTMYGWSAIPLMYLMGFLYNHSGQAYTNLVQFNYFSGIFTNLIDIIGEKGLQSLLPNSTRKFILKSLTIFPNYNLGKCLSNYFDFYQMVLICSLKKPSAASLECLQEYNKNIYSMEKNMIGEHLISMCVIGFIFLLLLFFWETTWWKIRAFFSKYIYFGIYKIFKEEKISKELSGDSDDEDVQNERKRVLALTLELLDSAIVMKELIKIYFKCPVVLAVKNISFEVQKGECFGLLGYSGAGKSTIFQILAEEDSATSGDVFIDGSNITRNFRKVTSKVSYCPQSDALLEYMTARETLIMYARLWGISENQINPYVNERLKSLQLAAHADKIIRTYSGGNKRRLSTAVAMTGNPLIILMDEPSTGVDPLARKLICNVVTEARKNDKAIVISSHSMEECDSICTKLAIMVEGKIVCLGSPQNLKNKFGNVYNLKVKVKSDISEAKLEEFKRFILVIFPGSELDQENQGILNYHIPRKDNNWGKVFGILEKAKQQYDLEDYCIGQMTLEQIFLTFSMSKNVPDVPDYMKKRELGKVSLNKMNTVSLEEKDKSRISEIE